MLCNENSMSPKKSYYYEIDHMDDPVTKKKTPGSFLVTHVSTMELVIASDKDSLQLGGIYTFLFRFNQVPYSMMGKVSSNTQRGQRMEYIIELINPSNDYRKTIKTYLAAKE